MDIPNNFDFLINFIMNNIPALIIFASGLIGGVAAWYSSNEQDKQNDTIQQLQERLVDKSDKLESAQAENLKLSKEISKITKKFSDRMTGGDSIMYLSSYPNSIMLSFKGDQPLRDLKLEIKNENDFSKRMKFISDNNGANMNGEQALSYINESIIYQKLFKVIDPPAKESVSPLIDVKDPEVGEKIHYSYRATALNGLFSGHIYVFHRSDNKILRSVISYHDDEIIKEFPKNYPRLDGQPFDPDFEQF